MRFHRIFSVLFAIFVVGSCVMMAQEQQMAQDQQGEQILNWPAPAYWMPSRVRTEARPRTEAVSAATAPIPFIAITPCRQYDSRSAAPLADNTPRTVSVSGAPCGIPASALAVSLNITVFNITGAAGNGVFKLGVSLPLTTAWINYPPTETQRGNAGVAPTNGSGQIVVQVNQGAGSVDFTVDVNGYFDNIGLITGVTAGTGLTGGGTSGNVTLGIANGGVGLPQLSATGSSNGQALVSNGSAVSWGSPAGSTNFTGSLAGDVTGTQSATVVALVGGQTAANVASGASAANAATSANTANTIVKRDGSGNFSAGTITASLSGNATTATTAATATTATNFSGSLAGEVTGTQGATVVSNATSANTANAIVRRDGSGNFSAGTVSLSSNLNLAGSVFQGGNRLLHTFGTSNLFLGALSGNFSMTGVGFNVGIGAGSLQGNTTGDNNMALGASALQANTTGSANVAVGADALVANTTGSTNIAIGTTAGSALTTESNNIDIGNAGVAADSGVIRIGKTGTQTGAFIAGISGVTVAGGVAVIVDGTGHLGTIVSSRRFKRDIEGIGDASDGVMKLRPVTFRYKPELDASGLRQYGLIAEEVAEVYPDLVVYNKDGQPETVRYHLLTPLLLNELRKQHQTIEDQRQEIKDLSARLLRLEEKMGSPVAQPALAAAIGTR